LVKIGVADKTELSPAFWLALILAGFAARLYLWWISIGTNDSINWHEFGSSIASNGLAATYQYLERFNHPPLMGLYAMEASRWSYNLLTFAHYLKIPGLAGEALTLWALARFASLKAAVAYAWLPASILVSGFHGNTDCLYAALVLVAVIAFDRQLYFLAGLLLAASLNVKLIPLMLLPLVFIASPNRTALLRLAAGLVVGPLALGWAVRFFRKTRNNARLTATSHRFVPRFLRQGRPPGGAEGGRRTSRGKADV